jgi:hypothetical protein
VLTPSLSISTLAWKMIDPSGVCSVTTGTLPQLQNVLEEAQFVLLNTCMLPWLLLMGMSDGAGNEARSVTVRGSADRSSERIMPDEKSAVLLKPLLALSNSEMISCVSLCSSQRASC